MALNAKLYLAPFLKKSGIGDDPEFWLDRTGEQKKQVTSSLTE